MKKKSLLFLSLGCLCALAACGGTSSSTTSAAPSVSVSSGTSQTSQESSSVSSVDTGNSTFSDNITDEEKVVLIEIAEGDFTKADFTEYDYPSTSVADGTVQIVNRYDVKQDGTLKVVIYKVQVDKGWGTYLTAYVGVDVETFLVTGVEFTGTMWSQVPADQWTPPEGGLGDFNDKFVGTDGNITDGVTGLTQSTTIYKELVKTAVQHAKVEFGLSEEDKAALSALAGTGTYKKVLTFTAGEVLTDRYDVTENGKVTKVIYRGTVALAIPQEHDFVAYVAVDTASHLITGYKTIGDVVSSAWSSHASSFEGWEDKFVGTDGTTVKDNITGATKTSEAFKTVAKAACEQAAKDFPVASTGDNTFSSDITAEEQTILAEVASGDFVKNTSFTENGVIKARYDVKQDGTLKTIVYKGSTNVGSFVSEINVYVAVDATTLKISDYAFDGKISSHNKDGDFADDALGLIGTDGTSTESVAHATVSSNAIKTIAQAAVKQANIDLGNLQEEVHIAATDESGKAVTSIAAKAFLNNTVVKKVYIPATITKINNDAFKGCTNLEEIVYEGGSTSDKLITLGNNVFEGCTSLTTVDINLNSLGKYAFKDCTGLTSIYVNAKSLGTETFSGCTNLSFVSFGKDAGASSRGTDIFKGCTSLANVVIDSANTHMEVVTYNGYKVLFGYSSKNAEEGTYSSGYALYAFGVTTTDPVTLTLDNHYTSLTKIADDSAFENLKISKYAVAEGSSIKYYADEQGAIYKDNTMASLQYLPNAYDGDFVIPASVTYVNTTGSDLYMSPELGDISVAEGNKDFIVENGILYAIAEYDDSQAGETIIKTDYSTAYYFNKSLTGIVTLNDSTYKICEYALANSNLDGIAYSGNIDVGTSFFKTSWKEGVVAGVKEGFKIYFADEESITAAKSLSRLSAVASYISDTPYVAE